MKGNKNIFIVIGIIVIVILIGAFVVFNQKDKLSESEIEEYLSLIPMDEEYSNKNVYSNVPIKKDSMGDELFLISELSKIGECVEENNCKFEKNSMTLKIELENYDFPKDKKFDTIPFSVVHEQIKEKYNYEIKSLKNAKSDEDVISAGGMDYVYQDEYFLRLSGGTNGGKNISLVDSYNVTDDKIEIYEYAIYYYNDEDNNIVDYNTKKETTLSEDYNLDNVLDYLKENKKDFTKYRHTFKKENDKFYWVQTEVAE